jgi:hypothetical protein
VRRVKTIEERLGITGLDQFAAAALPGATTL